MRSHLKWFSVYVTIVGVAAVYLAKHPEYNWDVIPYVGAVFTSEDNPPEVVHRETYRLVRSDVPESRFQEFVATSYRRGIFQNPQYLIQQLPFYKIRPGYVGVLRVLHAVGIDPVAATVGISIVCYVGICLILWFWIGRMVSGPAQVACAACLALSQPLLEAGGLTTPDALSSLFILLALFLFVEFDQIVVASLLLLGSLLIRTDNFITCVLFAALLFYRARHSAVWKRALALGYGCVAMLVVAVCHHAAANYGWSTTIYHSFIDALLDPAKATHPLSLRAFCKIVVGGAASIRYSSIGLCMLLFTCALFLRRPPVQDRDKLRMRVAQLMLASVLIHVAIFPVFRDRFFVAQYLIVCLVSACRLLCAPPPSATARSRSFENRDL
jgi:hypothetical protein